MFHRLESLWMIEVKAVTIEPFVTQAATEEAKDTVIDALRKTLSKPEPDLVPLVMEEDGKKYAVITGNSLKGTFRSIISAQLTKAGKDVCVQDVKLGDSGLPEGRKEQCKPDNPCFVCKWFGTAGRQGALHFGFLRSVKPLEEILAFEPIPMIAIRDDTKAVAKRAFLLIAPVKKGVEFRGWIKGENLDEEILGAIAEVFEMSKAGFVQLGGLKTRGYGRISMEITKIEKYSGAPFKLEKKYEGKELEEFLKCCRSKYHEMLKS